MEKTVRGLDPIAKGDRAVKTTSEIGTRAQVNTIKTRRENTSYTQFNKRVRAIPFPIRNQGGNMGGGVGPPPIFRTVGDKNFPPGLNMARGLQSGGTRSGVHNETGVCFDPSPRSVS